MGKGEAVEKPVRERVWDECGVASQHRTQSHLTGEGSMGNEMRDDETQQDECLFSAGGLGR